MTYVKISVYMKSRKSRGDVTERRGGENRLLVAVILDGDCFWRRAKLYGRRSNRRRKEPVERSKEVDSEVIETPYIFWFII